MASEISKVKNFLTCRSLWYCKCSSLEYFFSQWGKSQTNRFPTWISEWVLALPFVENLLPHPSTPQTNGFSSLSMSSIVRGEGFVSYNCSVRPFSTFHFAISSGYRIATWCTPSVVGSLPNIWTWDWAWEALRWELIERISTGESICELFWMFWPLVIGRF